MEEIKFIETLITMSDDTQNYWYGPRTRLTPHQDLQPQTLTLICHPARKTYICLHCTDLSEVTKALPLLPLEILVDAKSSLLNLLYPVGPVGCAPQVSNATKSSTCSDGGLDVLGGRDLNRSDLC
jgi:hypothetical protein